MEVTKNSKLRMDMAIIDWINWGQVKFGLSVHLRLVASVHAILGYDSFGSFQIFAQFELGL
jgi:hypothetical protein